MSESDSRTTILSQLRNNTVESYEMPNLDLLNPIRYSDPIAQFKEQATGAAGAKVIELADGGSIDAAVHAIYPNAKIIASNLDGVTATLNPDMVASAQELASADVGVVKGYIGVAENACIWIPQTMKERAICFASEYLVIILKKSDIVNNMHEAYEKIEKSRKYFKEYKFGTFISGPSKTADIESALVYGAQAARGVTIILT